MKIKFSIPGDPVPYLRMTQDQLKLLRIPDARIRGTGLQLKRRIQRYLAYKDLVRVTSLSCQFDRSPGQKVFLNVVIYFRTRAHGDPENVRKGIQDALFEQDKMVAGSVDFFFDPGNPRVEVEIDELPSLQEHDGERKDHLRAGCVA